MVGPLVGSGQGTRSKRRGGNHSARTCSSIRPLGDFRHLLRAEANLGRGSVKRRSACGRRSRLLSFRDRPATRKSSLIEVSTTTTPSVGHLKLIPALRPRRDAAACRVPTSFARASAAQVAARANSNTDNPISRASSRYRMGAFFSRGVGRQTKASLRSSDDGTGSAMGGAVSERYFAIIFALVKAYRRSDGAIHEIHTGRPARVCTEGIAHPQIQRDRRPRPLLL